MNGRTKKIAICSMTAAIAVVILLLSAIMPTGRIALAAIAGFCMVPAVLSCGIPYAIGSFAVSGAAALLLSPVKAPAVAYLLFLGWYPIAKSPLERIRSRSAGLVLKLLVFNAALAAAVFLFSRVMLSEQDVFQFTGWTAVLIWLAANIVFLLYDFAMSRMILIYLNRFIKK